MKSKIEFRFFEPQDNELRASIENDQMILEGYAAKYNVESRLISERGQTFIEILEPGAFKDNLKDDVYLTFNHSKDKILARTINNTLELFDDEVGLRFKAILNNTTDSKDLYERVLRKDIVENSFGFITDPKSIRVERPSNSVPIHKVSRIERLFDVSVVTHAAYPKTEVYARDLDELDIIEEPKTINYEPDEMMVQLKLKLK